MTLSGSQPQLQMERQRLSIRVEGVVQGVGFRPFVYRLARELSLSGWVRNTPAGVEVEVEGEKGLCQLFVTRLSVEAPPLARMDRLQTAPLPIVGGDQFEILESSHGETRIQVAPDGPVCDDCLRELFDPTDRRYRYPFITCTNCGPRYSLITGIPYDRSRTT
ncbi:MAG TPA: acylphosphatase, partial [Geobacterales bacterium]|nr:acylphosphatase [Geobacterales bacterium]